MGIQKQKWTTEEEDALTRGVLKHGAGKWRNILNDPEFAASLVNRTNVDLKDKWRNLKLNIDPGQTSKEKSRTPKGKTTFPAIPSSSVTMNSTPVPSPAAPVATVQNATPSSQNDDEANIKLRYDPLIFEALSILKEPNGSDINAIVTFIEQKQTIPEIQNLRKTLVTKLRRLVSRGKLEKVQNCYKIKEDTPTGVKLPDLKSPAPEAEMQPEAEVRPPPALTLSKVQPEEEVPASPTVTSLTFEEELFEASQMAADLIADAESKELLTDEKVREMEELDRMAEHNDAMLNLAEELFKKCLGGAIINFE